MDAASPVLVVDLLPQERTALLELLRSLPDEQWALPTPCPGWSVKDIALHLLGDDVGVLSRGRDGSGSPRDEEESLPWDELVAWLNQRNQQWVEATRGMSPALAIDLLEVTGRWTQDYFSGLDPHGLGDTVSWAGSGPAPNWLGVAREYTERWIHQQQIREAAGRLGLVDPKFLHPVLATFMRSLPRTYDEVDAPEGTVIEVQVRNDAGGAWHITKESDRWVLREGSTSDPTTRALLQPEDAWKLFTRALRTPDAHRAISVEGDERLARHLLNAVAIIA